jgi:hypothetical protein
MFFGGIPSSSSIMRPLSWNVCCVIVKTARNMFGAYERGCWVSYSQPNLQDRAIALITPATVVNAELYQVEQEMLDIKSEITASQSI